MVELHIIIIRITYPKLTYIQLLNLPISEQYRTDLKLKTYCSESIISSRSVFSDNLYNIWMNNISKIQTNPTIESQDMAAEVPGLLPSQNS